MYHAKTKKFSKSTAFCPDFFPDASSQERFNFEGMTRKLMYSGERKKCRFYKKGYCESLNRRMFLIFTQYIDMELLFQNM